MPDASGRFKGISVPAIPWHEELQEGLAGIEEERREAFNRVRYAQPDAEDDESAPE